MPEPEWREPTQEELEAIQFEIADVLAARLSAVIVDIARLFTASDAVYILRALADEVEAEVEKELQSILH